MTLFVVFSASRKMRSPIGVSGAAVESERRSCSTCHWRQSTGERNALPSKSPQSGTIKDSLCRYSGERPVCVLCSEIYNIEFVRSSASTL